MRIKRNEAGFSMIEVMFSVGLLAMVLYSFYKLPVLFKQNESKVVSIVTKDRLFKGFSQSFIEIAERADVGMRFQNLPIATACSTGKPCVRQLTAEGAFADSGVSEIGSIQFLRDEYGELDSRPAAGPSSPSRVRYRKPFAFSSTILNGEYYATWPLVDANSEPLVLMKRSTVPDHFFMDDMFANSNRDLSRYVIVRGTRPGIDVNAIENRPMLIYNVNDFTHYTVQRVAEARECKANNNQIMDECYAKAREFKANFDPDTTLFSRDGSPTVDTPFRDMNFYLLRLEPYSMADLQYNVDGAAAANREPARNFLPNPGISPTGWGGGQDSSLYLFPTQVLSLFEDGAPSVASTDLQAPVDAKRFGHYLHVLGSEYNGKIAFLPIDIVSYRLENLMTNNDQGVRTQDPQKRKILVLHTLGSQSSVVALADIGKDDVLMFARKLGRSELAVYHLK